MEAGIQRSLLYTQDLHILAHHQEQEVTHIVPAHRERQAAQVVQAAMTAQNQVTVMKTAILAAMETVQAAAQIRVRIVGGTLMMQDMTMSIWMGITIMTGINQIQIMQMV